MKGKIPDKFDWPSIRDEARNALIRQGIKRIKKWLETQAADLVEEILKTPAEAVIDDITKDAAQDLLDGGFGSLQKLWEKFTWDNILKGLEDELGKQLLKGLEKGLEDGAEAGLEAMFDALGGDYENSPAAMVGMEFSKYLAKQMVDELMSGVKGLDDLINSFESLQKRLSKKIQDFFNGKPLESGKATLPVARLTDKDNLTDFVITGLPTVLVCGQPIARISDMLFPSGKPVIQGSAIIEAGGLPIARETSGTAVPSQLTRSQSTVLAEGITSWTMMPGGEMICGFPNAVGGNMSLMPSSETTQTSSKRTLPDGKIYDSVQKTVTDPDTGKVQSIPNDARFDPESNSFYQLSQDTPLSPEQAADLSEAGVPQEEIEALKAAGEFAFRRDWSFDVGYSSSPFEQATIVRPWDFMRANEDGISTLGFPMKKGNYYAFGGLLDLGSPEWPGAGTGAGSLWMIPDRAGIWRMNDYFVKHDATFDPANQSLSEKLSVEWDAFLEGLSLDPVQNILQVIYSSATTSVALATS